jgi:hypothetical protein
MVSSQITRKKDSGEVISLGDDLKAAATDALKKAATLLGVGLHLYSEETRQQPVNGPDHPGGPGYPGPGDYPQRSGQHGHPEYPPGNSHLPPVNGYHDPGQHQGAQYQNHAPVHGHPRKAQYQGHVPVNGGQTGHALSAHPEHNIQTPKRLSSKQYRYLKQLASDRAMSSQELDKLAVNNFGCALDFLSSQQASELITELQQDKTAA